MKRSGIWTEILKTYSDFKFQLEVICYFVTASCYRSLNALTEVEEPAEMGELLGTGAHRHRSILPPWGKYVPGPRVLRQILSNRS